MGVRGRSSKCMFSFSECKVFWTRQKMIPVERHCSSQLVFDPGVERRSDVYHRPARKLPLITKAGLSCRRLGKADILSCQHGLTCSYLQALTVDLGGCGLHGCLGAPTPAPSRWGVINFSRCFQAPLPSQRRAPAQDPKSLCCR